MKINDNKHENKIPLALNDLKHSRKHLLRLKENEKSQENSAKKIERKLQIK